MKNKKIIFLVATVCCLAVAFACFSGFAPLFDSANSTAQSFDFPLSDSTYYYVYFVFDDTISITDIAYLYWQVYTYEDSTGSLIMSSSFSDVYSSNVLTLGLFRPSPDVGFKYYAIFAGGNDSTYKIPYISHIDVYDSNLSNVTDNVYINSRSVNLFEMQVYSSAFGLSDYNGFMVAHISARSYSDIEVETLAGNYRTLADQYDVLQGNYNTLQTQYNALQSHYDTIWQQYLDKETEYNDLVTDYENLDRVYNTLQSEYDSVSSQLENALNSNTQLRNELDSYKSGEYGLGFVGTAFEKVGDILQIEILPNITIGTIVAVPLILGVVFLVLRLVRGE